MTEKIRKTSSGVDESMKILSAIPGRFRLQDERIYRNASLAQVVEFYLESLQGIKASAANPVIGTVVVTYDVNMVDTAKLLEKIQKLMQAESAAFEYLKEVRQEFCKDRQQLKRARRELYFYGGLYVIFKVKKHFFGKFFLGESLPALEIASIITIVGGYPWLRRNYRKLGKYLPIEPDKMLMILAIGLTFAREGGKGILLLFMMALNDTLRARTKLQVRKFLLTSQPNPLAMVWCERKGTKVLLPVQSLEPGDLVIISAQEPILLDGVVMEGEGLINSTMYSGQAEIRRLQRGEEVREGMVVIEGEVKVRVTRVGEVQVKPDSNLHDLLLYEGVGDYQKKATVIALGFALAGLVLTGNPVTSLGVLLVMNPQVAGMALTSGLTNYLHTLERNGVVLRNFHAIEKIYHTDAIVFDKTGTLTEECLRIAGVESVDERYSWQEILKICTEAEAEVCYPVSVGGFEADDEDAKKVNRENQIICIPAEGVVASYQDKLAIIGNRRFMREERIPLNVSKAELIRRKGYIPIYVALEGRLVGKVYLAENIRPEVPGMLQELRNLGYENLTITSGDLQKNVRAVARNLGIAEYYARLDGAGKAAIVGEKSHEGTVLMVGDGINDAEAMRAADVSVAVGNAFGQLVSQADCLFPAESGIEHLPYLLQYTRTSYKHIEKNIQATQYGNLALGLYCLVGGIDLFEAESLSVMHVIMTLLNGLCLPMA